jgi:hypothetical protein
MLDDKATAWVHILPFVEVKDVASENHERVTRSYAGFDVPRREGTEVGHDIDKCEVTETQVEGGLIANVVQPKRQAQSLSEPALIRVRGCFAYRTRQPLVRPLTTTIPSICGQLSACSHLSSGFIYRMLNRYSRLLGVRGYDMCRRVPHPKAPLQTPMQGLGTSRNDLALDFAALPRVSQDVHIDPR